ncbi:MAG: YlxR family protein [Candidatus Gastranaerophilales bacterium]|nr:YlxR family protein [Candidatus Gastranaerophilales bacterium]
MTRTVVRKCQGCAKISDRENFIKITLNEGKLHINPSSKVLGRSLYVCPDIKCIKNVIKKKRLMTALKFKNFEEIQTVEAELLKMV